MNKAPAGPGPQPEFIKGLFSDISKTYDVANDIITFGMARGWRRKLVKWSQVSSGSHVLDCATGTGDLALDFKEAVGPDGQVVGSDFCEDMLNKAPKKAKQKNLKVTFELADVTKLPYPSNYYDVTSIAYGIRNVANPVTALHEMARVTKPGGYVMVLETGDQKNPILKGAINIYFKHLVPRLGGLVSGNRAAYEYLNRSSKKFPCREEFAELMMATGSFQKVEFKSLLGGASFIYKGLV